MATRKSLITRMFIIASFTITPNWKQPKYALTEERVNKMQDIHTMAYYLALKRN